MLAALAVAALVIGGVGATVTINQDAQDSAVQPIETVVDVQTTERADTVDM
jgi:hypothetical protein